MIKFNLENFIIIYLYIYIYLIYLCSVSESGYYGDSRMLLIESDRKRNNLIEASSRRRRIYNKDAVFKRREQDR